MITGLTPREVQAIVVSLNSSDLEKVYVWTHTLSDWQSIRAFPEFNSFDGLKMPDTPPILTMNLTDEKSADDQQLEQLLERSAADSINLHELQAGLLADVSDLNVESESRLQKPRKHKRFRKEFPVEIECGGKVFKTLTQNISVGGMNLKTALPAWVNGYFSVKIFQPLVEQTVGHTGWVVTEGTAREKRKHVAFLPFKKRQTEDQFEEWLLAA